MLQTLASSVLDLSDMPGFVWPQHLLSCFWLLGARLYILFVSRCTTGVQWVCLQDD